MLITTIYKKVIRKDDPHQFLDDNIAIRFDNYACRFLLWYFGVKNNLAGIGQDFIFSKYPN
jgi:hypothetical protein